MSTNYARAYEPHREEHFMPQKAGRTLSGTNARLQVPSSDRKQYNPAIHRGVLYANLTRDPTDHGTGTPTSIQQEGWRR